MSPFKDLDAQGALRIYKRLGVIKLSNGTVIIVFAYFSSTNQNESNILGYGWNLNIADLSLYKKDAKNLEMKFPNGSLMEFESSEPKNPNIYKCASWTATVKKNRIDVAQACGVSALFESGRILKIRATPNTLLNYIYKDERLVEIKEADTSLLKITYLQEEQKILMDFNVAPSHTEIVLGKIDSNFEKELVMPIAFHLPANQNYNIKYDFTNENEYSFSEDSVRFGLNTFKWNPKTGFVTYAEIKSPKSSIEFWKYKVKQERGKISSIARVSNSGLEEFWHEDMGMNFLIESLNGKAMTEKRFIRAGLGEKLLSFERTTTKDGNTTEMRYLYDSKFRIISKLKNREILETYLYDDKKNSITKLGSNNAKLWTKFIDDKKRITKIEYP